MSNRRINWALIIIAIICLLFWIFGATAVIDSIRK